MEFETKFIINGENYVVHTDFLIINSNYFKKLLENSNNKLEPINIINGKNELIEKLYVEQIIRWFFHKQINFIKYMTDNIDDKYNLNTLMNYYYITKHFIWK